jgi:hypothetical protein
MVCRLKTSTFKATSAFSCIFLLFDQKLKKKNEVVLCDRCGKLLSDPIVHAVALCDYLEEIRDKVWCDVITINPIAFSTYLANMSHNELCYCLLSCDSGDFHLDSEEQETFQTMCVKYI